LRHRGTINRHPCKNQQGNQTLHFYYGQH